MSHQYNLVMKCIPGFKYYAKHLTQLWAHRENPQSCTLLKGTPLLLFSLTHASVQRDGYSLQLNVIWYH